MPHVSAQSGFAVRVPEKMPVVKASPPELLFLGCAISTPFGWDLSWAEPKCLFSQNSGLYCDIPHPSSLTQIFHWIIVFQPLKDFILFTKHVQKYCWKVHSLSMLLALPLCCQGAAQNCFGWIKVDTQLLVNFLLRCSKMSPLVVCQHNLKYIFLNY